MSSMGKDPEIGAPELSLDLFRTFSTHSVLSSKRALEAVRRIVTAYGRRNHTNAYSSNVNYIAAYLLAVLGLAKEEEAFWTLTALLERRLPASSVLEVRSLGHCSYDPPGVLHASLSDCTCVLYHMLWLSGTTCSLALLYCMNCHCSFEPVELPHLRLLSVHLPEAAAKPSQQAVYCRFILHHQCD